MGLRQVMPREDTVDLCDFLVLPSIKTGRPSAFPISRRSDHYVVARDDSNTERVIRYDWAIVLKADGSYLVGESVRPE